MNLTSKSSEKITVHTNKPMCTTAYFTLQMQQNKICQWTCGISFDLEKFIANSFVA